MLRHLGAASAAVIAMAAFAPAHAAVDFVSAKANTNAKANTYMGSTQTGDGYGTNANEADTFQPRLGVAARADASGLDQDGGYNAQSSAKEQSNAYFTTTSQGYLNLTGQTAASAITGNSAEAYSEGQAASYTFTVDTASTINLSYALSETYGDIYSYSQLYLGAADFSSQLFNQYLTPNTSDQLSFNLGPGTYLLSLYTQNGDYTYAANGTVSDGAHNERVDFNVAAAPEPGTWALMMAGVGLAGAALRRRKTVGALAA